MMDATKSKLGEFSYCICGNTNTSSNANVNPLTCVTCERKSHRSCVMYTDDDSDFECMLCKVQLLDPFNVVVDFLWYQVLGNTSVIFEIDSDDLEKLKSKEFDVYMVSIPLIKPKLVHEWPRTFEMRINNNIVHAVKEPNWDRKRRDNPIKITYALSSKSGGVNFVEICSTTFGDDGPLYLVIAMVSKQITIQRMVDDIQKKCSISYEDGLKRVVGIVSCSLNDDEIECLETRHKIELNCPITLDRINIPTRGKYCAHLQCYDLEGFLQVMQNTSNFNVRWRCPECHLIVKPYDLVVDGYFKHILDQVPRSISSVELDKEGKYRSIINGYSGPIIKELNSPSNQPKKKMCYNSNDSLDSDNIAHAGFAFTKNPSHVIELDSDAQTANDTGIHQSRFMQPEVVVIEDSDADDIPASTSANDDNNGIATTFNTHDRDLKGNNSVPKAKIPNGVLLECSNAPKSKTDMQLSVPNPKAGCTRQMVPPRQRFGTRNPKSAVPKRVC
ncbi:bifunctional Zinc finger [Babesia duncani]|uniref:Bifunctional Zinc finger n=1 Tax=Babesia duncani TaxID=323732 RepID=A0AAD9PNH4_9APIC|nr:bifunctional Zinc finger [Babesia duncani]